MSLFSWSKWTLNAKYFVCSFKLLFSQTKRSLSLSPNRVLRTCFLDSNVFSSST
uniref:Uncharacterized protein n=1 Tax=Rhizophora mucronata TaxID=61149 RepID=A0A2P2IZF5_RHIMU